MRSTFVRLAVLVALGASAVPARAQKTYMVGLSGGVAIPVNKLSDDHGTGSTFMASLILGVADVPVGFRFDGMFNNFGGSTAGPGIGAFDGADVKVTAGIANLIFTFPGTRAKPYLIAGGGLYAVKPDIPGTDSQNHFGLSGGVGTTFGLGRFAAFVETRYHSISRNKEEGGRLAFVPITLGIMF